jgi:hypothetical protein
MYFRTSAVAKGGRDGASLFSAMVWAAPWRTTEKIRILGSDALEMSAGRFTTTFRSPYVYVECAARVPAPVALGEAVVGAVVTVVEGVRGPV